MGEVSATVAAAYCYAMCIECRPLLPMPFGLVHNRDEWAEAHTQGTGHRVVIGRDDVDFGALNG